MVNRRPSGRDMLNALYQAAPNLPAYNPGTPTWDVQTEGMIADYIQQRGTIYAASNKVAAAPRTLMLDFLKYTDQAFNVKDQVGLIAATYAPPLNPSSFTATPFAVLRQKADSAVAATTQIAASALDQARALIPQINDACYLSVQADVPVALTQGIQGQLDTLYSSFLQILATASNKQQQANQIAASCAGDLNAAYIFMNGTMDIMIRSFGVDLVAVHRAYADALRASGKLVPNQALIDLLQQDAFNQLVQLAQSVSARTIQVVQQEMKAQLNS